MNRKADVPEGWAVPDDVANEICKELNESQITPDEMLLDKLPDVAQDIAILEPDPKDWGWWIHYLIDGGGG